MKRMILLSAAVASLAVTPAYGQDYPNKPVRIIVAVPPGGPADTLTRLVSPELTKALGQTFVADNRSGANGNIAYEMAARATPDGYTIVSVAAGVAINPSLYRKVQYDPIRDFAPITLGITVPNILVVHPSVPVKSVKELIAYAKAQNGKLAFASAGNGTSGHLALELFRDSAGIDFVHVPYKGGGPALAEVIAGQVQALFSIALTAIPQVKAGKVRALAISSANRSAVAPDLPTVAESGIPGFEVIGWFGWLAPAKTPQAIVTRLNRELVRILEDKAMHDRLVGLGSDPAPTTPQQFAAFIRKEHDKWARLIRQAGIRLD
ncbi:MAG TPA: tripartite tricarboxylate transporter substrate binding protein [Burkholderiales bacterium]|nr:tripartite tricarboxylate transporter substrate binding protein [Burkholderiales bacterium]